MTETGPQIAERVYPIEDRMETIKHFRSQIRNIDQRLRRNHVKAGGWLTSFLQGDRFALLKYEPYAEKIQLDASLRDQTAARIQRLISEDWYRG